MLTTEEAAILLQVERRQVQRLIKAGKLKATKMGRDYFIKPIDLQKAKEQRKKAGRPKNKNKTSTTEPEVEK